jgi:glutathione S-transferase
MRSRLLSLARHRLAAPALGLAAAHHSSQPQQCRSWFGGEQPEAHFHLRYFDARGVAETSRLLVVLGGAQERFTDERWPLDFSKPRDEMAPGMAAARAQGLLAANLDRAPVLVVDGKHEIGQSKSIERFLAKKLGLLGGDDIEAAKIDMFTEHVRDLKDKYQQAKRVAKRETLAAFFSTTMPTFLQKMERVCTGDGGGPLVGSKLSLADVALFVLITDYFDNKEGAKEALRDCPKLAASVEAVGAQPAIGAYLAQRPVTPV